MAKYLLSDSRAFVVQYERLLSSGQVWSTTYDLFATSQLQQVNLDMWVNCSLDGLLTYLRTALK